jgi:hypothetical protein
MPIRIASPLANPHLKTPPFTFFGRLKSPQKHRDLKGENRCTTAPKQIYVMSIAKIYIQQAFKALNAPKNTPAQTAKIRQLTPQIFQEFWDDLGGFLGG